MRLGWVEHEERPLTPEMQQFIREMDVSSAWAAWVEYCCIERNGRHFWMVQIEYGSVTSVHCTICRTPLEYVHPGCAELMYAEFCIEVDIDYATYPATPMGPTEYDVYVNALPREEESWEET